MHSYTDINNVASRPIRDSVYIPLRKLSGAETLRNLFAEPWLRFLEEMASFLPIDKSVVSEVTVDGWSEICLLFLDRAEICRM